MLPSWEIFFTFLRSRVGLLEGLDDQGSCGWNHLDSDLAVLHDQLACHIHALPFFGGLAQVLTNRLWGQLVRTDFGGQCRHWRYFTTRHTDDDGFNLVWVSLSHGESSYSPC